MTRSLLTAAVLLATAAPCAAQGLRASVELGAYATASTLDYHSTHRFLTRTDLREVNPLGAWIDHRPNTMIALSVAGDAALTAFLYRKLETRPKLRTTLLWSVVAGRTFLAARNYRNTAIWLQRNIPPTSERM